MSVIPPSPSPEILPPLPVDADGAVGSSARRLVAAARSTLPARLEASNTPPNAGAAAPIDLDVLVGGRDVRRMTPRQMVDLSLNLYAAGVIDWEEYALLAFQPELHPDYDLTIGALTGEPAAPDTPRDFIDHWRRRLAFEQRHGAGDPDILGRVSRIVLVLRQIDRSVKVVGQEVAQRVPSAGR